VDNEANLGVKRKAPQTERQSCAACCRVSSPSERGRSPPDPAFPSATTQKGQTRVSSALKRLSPRIARGNRTEQRRTFLDPESVVTHNSPWRRAFQRRIISSTEARRHTNAIRTVSQLCRSAPQREIRRSDGNLCMSESAPRRTLGYRYDEEEG
jgi:hypothetical protein